MSFCEFIGTWREARCESPRSQGQEQSPVLFPESRGASGRLRPCPFRHQQQRHLAPFHAGLAARAVGGEDTAWDTRLGHHCRSRSVWRARLRAKPRCLFSRIAEASQMWFCVCRAATHCPPGLILIYAVILNWASAFSFPFSHLPCCVSAGLKGMRDLGGPDWKLFTAITGSTCTAPVKCPGVFFL